MAILVAALLGVAAAAGATPVTAPPSSQQVADEEEYLDEGHQDEDTIGEDEVFDDWGDGFEDELSIIAVQRATAELGRAKRAAAARLAKLSGAGDVLRPCLRAGPGWKRIRAVRNASQRNLYAAAARRLLGDMKLLLSTQQPRIVAYETAFQRFVADLQAVPVASATLRAAIVAQGRRLAAYRDIRTIRADCGVFNRLTARVREFPTRSAAQIVRADYRAAPLARRVERAISNQLRRIDRRHGIGYRDAETLAAAAALIVELGGEPGHATGFQYALSLR